MQDKLDVALSILESHAKNNPLDAECILTELNSICNKYDPEIGRTKSPYPLFLSNWDKCDEVLAKIRNIAGNDLKIPDLRFEADKISTELKIPLPSSTRKHKETLLRWFEIHWREIEIILNNKFRK